MKESPELKCYVVGFLTITMGPGNDALRSCKRDVGGNPSGSFPHVSVCVCVSLCVRSWLEQTLVGARNLCQKVLFRLRLF